MRKRGWVKAVVMNRGYCPGVLPTLTLRVRGMSGNLLVAPASNAVGRMRVWKDLNYLLK